MGKEQNREKRFCEQLDRLLAGEEARPGPQDGNEMLSTLEFARHMVSLRPAPSPVFAAMLKARLLERLSQQEEAERKKRQTGMLQRLFPRLLTWQFAATAAMVLFLLVGTVLWRTGVFESNGTGVSVTASIAIDASTDKVTYRPGEVVQIKVDLRNTTSEPMKIDHFPPIISLMSDSGQPVYTFAEGTRTVVLAPDGVASFTVAWNQRDDKGAAVPGGRYSVELEDLDLQGRAIRLKLTNPVQFEIHPVQ